MWYKFSVTRFIVSLYDWLVLAHVLAAMVWLGALLIVLIVVATWDMVFKLGHT